MIGTLDSDYATFLRGDFEGRLKNLCVIYEFFLENLHTKQDPTRRLHENAEPYLI